MAFTEVQDLACDTAISLGGRDKKTGKPNPTSITGYYIGTREFDSKFGRSKIHILQTAKGTVGVYGKTDLDRKMTAVTAGWSVRITQNGSTPTNKGNDMLKFKVEVDKENFIQVDLPNSNEEEGVAVSGGDENDAYEYSTEEEDLPVETSRPVARTTAPADKARVQALIANRK